MAANIICVEMIGKYPCPCTGYTAAAQSTRCTECQHVSDSHPRQPSPEPIVPDPSSDNDEAASGASGHGILQPSPVKALRMSKQKSSGNGHIARFTFENLMGASEDITNAREETNRTRLRAFDKPLDVAKTQAMRRSNRIASNPVLSHVGSGNGKARV